MKNAKTLLHSALAAALLLPLAAQAGVFTGTPEISPSALSGTVDAAQGHLVSYELDDCNDTTFAKTVDAWVDLADGLTLDIPQRDWCSLTLYFDGDLELAGSANGGWAEDVDGTALVLDRVETQNADFFVLDDLGVTATTVKLGTPQQ